MATKSIASGVTSKRLEIDKSNAQVVAAVAIAAFVTIFCLVAAKAVWGQTRYQARVTTVKEQANKQLKQNAENFDNLSDKYQDFDSNNTNILGGSSTGSGDKDGTNSQIVLDALPSTYDFPALTSSLEKILSNQNVKLTSISGTDDQVNQQTNVASPTPQPVQVPFSFTVSNASYDSVNKLISTLQQSIRPIQIDTVDLSGGASNMSLSVKAHTYFQPAKSLSITKKVVK